MKIALKWLLIGIISSLVLIFGLMYIEQLSRGGGDWGLTAAYEALMGTLVLTTMTAGLLVLIPTLIIGATGFVIESIIRKRKSI